MAPCPTCLPARFPLAPDSLCGHLGANRGTLDSDQLFQPEPSKVSRPDGLAPPGVLVPAAAAAAQRLKEAACQFGLGGKRRLVR